MKRSKKEKIVISDSSYDAEDQAWSRKFGSVFDCAAVTTGRMVVPRMIHDIKDGTLVTRDARDGHMLSVIEFPGNPGEPFSYIADDDNMETSDSPAPVATVKLGIDSDDELWNCGEREYEPRAPDTFFSDYADDSAL